MSRQFNTRFSAVVIALFAGLMVAPAAASAATQWVALTGSAGANTSCASPGYIGVPAVENVILNVASSGDTIHLCAGTWDLSETASGGFQAIDKSLTFEGSGQGETIIDGAGTGSPAISNGLDSADSISLTVSDLTIQNALAEAPSAIVTPGTLTIEDAIIRNNGGFSGAVGMLEDGGSLVIRRSTFTGQGEGAEYPTFLALSYGSATIEDSTFANNVGRSFGGVVVQGGYEDPFEVTIDSSTFSGLSAECISALGAFGNAETTITNSTFTDNQAGDDECASAHVLSGGGPLVMRSSTFAGNTGVRGSALGDSGELLGIGGLTLGNNVIVGDPDAGLTCERNLPGVFTNEGGNVISDGTNGCTDFVGGNSPSLQTKVPASSIALDPLALNAPGTTETMALGADSVARGAAIDADCPATDQRGVSRPANACDSGAYQYAAPVPSGKPKLKLSVKTPKKAKAGQAFGFTIKISNLTSDEPARAVQVNGNSTPTTAKQVKTCAKLPKGLFVVKSGGGKVKGRTICWTRSSLAAGKSVTYRLTVRSSKTRSGSLRVSGTVSASNDAGATVKASGAGRVLIIEQEAPKPEPPAG